MMMASSARKATSVMRVVSKAAMVAGVASRKTSTVIAAVVSAMYGGSKMWRLF
jgi:hypothetical protein